MCANTGACVVLFGYRDFVQAFSRSKYLSTTCVWTATWNRADWNREVKSLAKLFSVRLKFIILISVMYSSEVCAVIQFEVIVAGIHN